MKVERFYFKNSNWYLEYYNEECYYSSFFVGDFSVVLSRYLELIDKYDFEFVNYCKKLKNSKCIKSFLNSL